MLLTRSLLLLIVRYESYARKVKVTRIYLRGYFGVVMVGQVVFLTTRIFVKALRHGIATAFARPIGSIFTMSCKTVIQKITGTLSISLPRGITPSSTSCPKLLTTHGKKSSVRITRKSMISGKTA